MRFADPAYLWLLLAVPVMVVYLVFLREKDIPTLTFSSFASLSNLRKGIELRSWTLVPGTIKIAAFVLMVLAMARPQKGLRSEEMTTKATDIMICLDASRSMLAIDFKPDNRFHVAKGVVEDFIKGREQDRLGLVLFAEYAITQCPLTTDKSALLTILESLQVGSISPDQTAIGVGLATCVNRLKNSKAKSKVIILVTDGANNAGNIDPITAAKTAAAFGIKIYSIGAGTTGETMMPVDDPNFGRRLVPIQSDLNEDELLRIASESNGKYYRAKSEGALKEIFKEIDSLEKTDIKIKEFVDYKELYWPFLISAALLLMIEAVLIKTQFRTLP